MLLTVLNYMFIFNIACGRFFWLNKWISNDALFSIITSMHQNSWLISSEIATRLQNSKRSMSFSWWTRRRNSHTLLRLTSMKFTNSGHRHFFPSTTTWYFATKVSKRSTSPPMRRLQDTMRFSWRTVTICLWPNCCTCQYTNTVCIPRTTQPVLTRVKHYRIN